jgi:hypothetical protein
MREAHNVEGVSVSDTTLRQRDLQTLAYSCLPSSLRRSSYSQRVRLEFVPLDEGG